MEFSKGRILIKSNLPRYFCNMTTQWGHNTHTIQAYEPPTWAKHLHYIPKSRVQLAQLPTPVHRWNIPGKPPGFEVYIKRDDLTGSTLSGNKVRKLEFLMADALSKGCKHVITCGGIQSNHCRATAAAASQLGLHCHLVLRADQDDIKDMKQSDFGCAGNYFLDQLLGSTVYLVNRKSPQETTLKPMMRQIAEKIQKEHNEKSYVIPVGGSDVVGLFGYIEGYSEIISQGALEHVSDIVFACGSGGTAEGLALANHLAGNTDKLRIHGIAVSDDAVYFHEHLTDILTQVGLAGKVRSHDILNVIEGYKGQGYGIAQEEDYEFMHVCGKQTGIVLDPTYSGKAARGLVTEINTKPHIFLGNKILFIHTGGIFGAMDGRMANYLMSSNSTTKSKFYTWRDIDTPPWSIDQKTMKANL